MTPSKKIAKTTANTKKEIKFLIPLFRGTWTIRFLIKNTISKSKSLKKWRKLRLKFSGQASFFLILTGTKDYVKEKVPISSFMEWISWSTINSIHILSKLTLIHVCKFHARFSKDWFQLQYNIPSVCQLILWCLRMTITHLQNDINFAIGF